MKLTRHIRLKEREIDQARLALGESVDEFKRVLHERLASRTALAVGFTGGLVIGWSRRRRPRKPLRSRVHHATERAKRSLPPNWLGSYLVWPFVLATARDLVISHRPSRSEGENFSNR